MQGPHFGAKEVVERPYLTFWGARVVGEAALLVAVDSAGVQAGGALEADPLITVVLQASWWRMPPPTQAPSAGWALSECCSLRE